MTIAFEVLHYLRCDFEQFGFDLDFGCSLDTIVVGTVLELGNL